MTKRRVRGHDRKTTEKTPIPSYETLFAELAAMVEEMEVMSREGRNDALLHLYWQVGKRVEAAVSEDAKMITRLSRDLNARFGSGYSVRNLHYMRKFHRLFDEAIVSKELSWSHYRALLSLSREPDRRELFELALSEKLSNARLSILVRFREGLPVPRLPRHSGPLRICKVLKASADGGDRALLDIGFETRIAVKTPGLTDLKDGELLEVSAEGVGLVRRVQAARRYFFEGTVERVVDGDTMLVVLAMGFGIERRMRLRLNGVDAEPIETEEGQKAFVMVRRRLKIGMRVVVETFRMDPYGRYLGNVFYTGANRDDDAVSILENGRFLNQELLDSGLAIVR